MVVIPVAGQKKIQEPVTSVRQLSGEIRTQHRKSGAPWHRLHDLSTSGPGEVRRSHQTTSRAYENGQKFTMDHASLDDFFLPNNMGISHGENHHSLRVENECGAFVDSPNSVSPFYGGHSKSPCFLAKLHMLLVPAWHLWGCGKTL